MYYDDLYYYEENNIEQLDYPDRQYSGGIIALPPIGGGQYPTPMGPPPAFSSPIPAWQSGPSGIRGCYTVTPIYD
ncbi:hypothetical protein [Falsibacillus pallidus]|uniref:Uncharacterized protein n=1 Tax=Falsibacillus pallidus TaxID=493781 RepID=A0A370G4P5_9BACI|nr:hypothetical protein [Falsibacillus pallidus]RDI37554.1 hypothetical protein DFR59_12151 [Falsibacillus pallidus]